MTRKLRGLYAVTPECADSEALLRKAEQALRGGIALLQYRSKAPRPDLAEARELARLSRRYGVPLIVNDDIDLALEVDADGAHLGRHDGDLALSRKQLRGKLLGASCYDSLERARSAVAAGADYVAFGSVFTSGTKPGATRAPLSLFAAARALHVPLCAIGGITAENAALAVKAGADLLAVIADLFGAEDVTDRARRYAAAFA